MHFTQETKQELLDGIVTAVRDAVNEFRVAYRGAQHVHSPHLIPEIAEAIAGRLDDISQGEWNLERQKAVKERMADAAAVVIAQYRSVYPNHTTVSSPHLPEAIATAVMEAVDNVIYRIERAAREEREARRQAEVSPAHGQGKRGAKEKKQPE